MAEFRLLKPMRDADHERSEQLEVGAFFPPQVGANLIPRG